MDQSSTLTCISAALKTLGCGRNSQFFDNIPDSQNEEGKSKSLHSLWIQQIQGKKKNCDTSILQGTKKYFNPKFQLLQREDN